MFWHSFKYNLLITLRDKNQLFWSLIFVVILGTLFNMTFSKIYDIDENFKSIKVAAYIENPTVKTVFSEIEDNTKVGEKDEVKLMDVTYTENLDAAKELLTNDEVVGVFYSDGMDLKLIISDEGESQSILSQIVTVYHKEKTFIEESYKSQGEKDTTFNRFPEIINEEIVYATAEQNPFLTYFYNLIAMGCLFASFMGLAFSIDSQANLSNLGARRAMGENNKIANGIGGLLAIILSLSAIALVAAIYLKAIGVEIGERWDLIILIIVFGNMLGVSLGYFIGKLGNMQRKTKEALTTVVSLACCFLSGLMVGDMRMMVEDFCPLINKLNPAVMVSDSFIAINQFGDIDRLFKNIIAITITSAILFFGGIVIGRRKHYASI